MKNQWSSDDDSSYTCRLSQNSQQSQSNSSEISHEASDCSSFMNNHQSIIRQADVREQDSYYETMCKFVQECLKSKPLMNKLSSYIKKAEYQPPVKPMELRNKLLNVMIQNKVSILFILIGIFMITSRVSDLQILQREELKKQCLTQFPTSQAANITKCITQIPQVAYNQSFLKRIKLMFFDFHQFFYMSIILCASYFLFKNAYQLLSTPSFSEYEQEYKQIHNLQENKTITLAELKKQMAAKKRENRAILHQAPSQNTSLNNQNMQSEPQNSLVKPSKLFTDSQIKILGVTINLNIFAFNKKKE